MNSTFQNSQNYSICNNLLTVYNSYIKVLIGVIGTVLNFICIVIFYKLIRNSTQKDNLNKYLLIKSIADTLTYVIIMTQSASLSTAHKNYAYQVIYLIVNRYLLFVFELISMFLEIASILNRYFAFTRINKKLEKIGFKAVVSFMLIYSFGFYVYKFFDEKIERATNINTNETYYKIAINTLGDISFVLGYIHSTVRDGICVLLILILNILTLIKLRKMMKNKMHLQSKSLSSDKKLNQTGIRLTKMVVATASITFFGRVLTFIKYITVNLINSNDCFSAFSNCSFFACNLFNLVLYYYFNLNFKKIFLAYLSYKNLSKCKCVN